MIFGSNCTRQGHLWPPARTSTTSFKCAICASGAVVASALPPWSGGNGHCAWSPDGRTLLVSQGDGGQIPRICL